GSDGQLHAVSGAFTYSWFAPHLTGNCYEDISKRILGVFCEVDVRRAGKVHIEGRLYSTDGRAVVFAQNTTDVESGLGWVEFPFDGLAIREKGIDGPFVLRFVTISTSDEIPGFKSKPTESFYVTAPYRADVFR